MSILSSIFRTFFFHYVLVIQVHVLASSTSKSIPIIDSQIGDINLIIRCPVDRTRWSLPSILQWYRSKDAFSKPIASQFDNYPVHIDDFYRNKYSLQSNGSLKIERVQLNDNDTFECRLILIDRGLLDVKEKYFVTIRVNEEPRFINISDSLQVVTHYSTVRLFCKIYGVPIPTVNWFRILPKIKQTDDEEILDPISNNSDILTLANVDDQMAGKYRCVGMNRLGSIQTEFQLLIRGSIYWRQFPESKTIKMNQSLVLQCEGESSDPIQYQWLKNELPISETFSPSDRIRTYSDGVLTINNAQPSDHGSYVCVISTSRGALVRSRPAQIVIKYPPIPSKTRFTKNLTLIRGSSGSCPCLLDAYPSIQSVSWYRNDVAIRIESRGGGYSISSDYGLVIRSVKIDDAGMYFCRAQNSEGFGHDSLPFYVFTKEPIKFTSKPDAIYNVNEGDRLFLPCVAFGQPKPTINWFKDSIELNNEHGNLTIDRIEKTHHGQYICQAINEHTTTNITVLVQVENTTPQAPLNIQYRQLSKHLHVSWEPGYDGGRHQYFIIWYRNVDSRKKTWNQLRILPENSTDFVLFDLKLKETYELTIVGENDFGLGTFSPIVALQLNETDEISVGYLLHSNETFLSRPLSPINLRLSYYGSNLHVTWNHPDHDVDSDSIIYYVIQWKSTILFNNQHAHQSAVIHYPMHSFTVRDVKQSSYIVRVISYSIKGTYSLPIESQINIRFQSIFPYSGSNQFLLILLGILILLSILSISLCLICMHKYYHHRRTYCTDLECVNSKRICGCFPSIRYRLTDCSHIKADRYHASLLKTNDLPTTPLCVPQNRLISSTPTGQFRTASPQESITDSMISLAKVTTIPRCRDSILSSAINGSQVVTSSTTFTCPNIDDGKMSSFFETTPVNGHVSPVPYIDFDARKNASRLPLEAVPETSEIDLVDNRYTFDPTVQSTLPHKYRSSHPIQPSPMLITFDSSSLKRRN